MEASLCFSWRHDHGLHITTVFSLQGPHRSIVVTRNCIKRQSCRPQGLPGDAVKDCKRRHIPGAASPRDWYNRETAFSADKFCRGENACLSNFAQDWLPVLSLPAFCRFRWLRNRIRQAQVRIPLQRIRRPRHGVIRRLPHLRPKPKKTRSRTRVKPLASRVPEHRMTGCSSRCQTFSRWRMPAKSLRLRPSRSTRW